MKLQSKKASNRVELNAACLHKKADCFKRRCLFSLELTQSTYLPTALPCNCCDLKARAAYAQCFTLWQQAAIEIMRRNHSARTLVIVFNRSHVSIGSASTPQQGCQVVIS